MKRNIPWLLLSLSVLFNLFFLAGYMKAQRRPMDATATPVAAELDLDERQTAVLSECRTRFGEDAKVFHDGLALTREAFRVEMERDAPDPARLAELIDQEMEFAKQWRLAHVERLVQFIGALNPEQRRELADRMARSPRHAARMEQMLQRFDRDGDGRLDEAETAEAVEFFESKDREMQGRRQRMMMRRYDSNGDGRLDPDEKAEMEAGRQRMIQKYDADGDGELNPEEEAELRRSMRQRGWGGGPGGGRRNRGPLPSRP